MQPWHYDLGRGRGLVGQRFHPYSPSAAPVRHPLPPPPPWCPLPRMPAPPDSSAAVWSGRTGRGIAEGGHYPRACFQNAWPRRTAIDEARLAAHTAPLSPSSLPPVALLNNGQGLSSREVMATHAGAGRGVGRGARRGLPPSRANIELNKQIQCCSTAAELCELIACSVHGFNPANVSTALRKLLQAGRKGVGHGARERALQQLEECALQQMPEFEPRHLAATLHIIAKERHGALGLLPALEARAWAVAGECNPQAMTNIPWAYASMGRRPGEGVLGALEARAGALSGECNPYHVANMRFHPYSPLNCGGYGMKTRAGCERRGNNTIQPGPWDGHQRHNAPGAACGLGGVYLAR